MKVTIFTLLLCIVTFPLIAQDITWEQVYEDDGHAFSNSIEDILLLDDGGYFLVGAGIYFNATNLRFIHLVRTDESGNLLWKKYLNKDEQNLQTWERAHTIVPLDDGDFLIGGSKNLFWSYDTIFLLKIDEEGEILSTNHFIGDYMQTKSNRMLKIDNELLWAGTAQDSLADYTFLLKTDLNGNEIWSKTMLPSEMGSQGLDFAQTSDGGFAISGYQDDNMILAKTNENGDLQWSNSYGDNNFSKGLQILENEDGFLIGGGAWVQDTLQAVVWQTDNDGDLIWQKTIPGIAGFVTGLKQKDNGNYVLTTSSFGFFDDFYSGNGFFITLDQNGNVLNQIPLSGNGMEIEETGDGGYLTAGGVAGQFSVFSYFIKIGGLLDGLTTVDYSRDFTLFPNPIAAADDFFIKNDSEQFKTAAYFLTNSSGQIVLEGAINPGINKISTPYLTAGNYFLSLRKEGKLLSVKSVMIE